MIARGTDHPDCGATILYNQGVSPRSGLTRHSRLRCGDCGGIKTRMQGQGRTSPGKGVWKQHSGRNAAELGPSEATVDHCGQVMRKDACPILGLGRAGRMADKLARPPGQSRKPLRPKYNNRDSFW
jgi:hypothetical protein